MKIIENKPTDISTGQPEKPVLMNYFDLCKLIINQPAQQGFTIEQMRERLTIIGIFDTASNKPSVEMELKDFTVLKENINQFRWAKVHKNIVEFVDYINSL